MDTAQQTTANTTMMPQFLKRLRRTITSVSKQNVEN